MKIIEIIQELFTLPQESKTQQVRKGLRKKDIRLYSAEGKMIKEWSGVYFTRWSENVYFLYEDAYEEVLLERIDKGVNMLLSAKNSERVIDAKK